MAEGTFSSQRRPPPPPPPRPPTRPRNDSLDDENYEAINPTTPPYSSLLTDRPASQYHEYTPLTTSRAETSDRTSGEDDERSTSYEYYIPTEPAYDYSNDYRPSRASDVVIRKTELFKRSPREFLAAFETTRDEMRTDDETIIIVHLLKKNPSNAPILDGNLDQLALLACCSSPHVVKRALDALLNEIFLAISDFSRIRCRNILAAENIIRQTFFKFLKVDHPEAKRQRMTTYAWLITFALLKCSEEECVGIATDIKTFDKTLEVLLRENPVRDTFRYGIYVAKEAIKQILHLLNGRKNSKESLQCSIDRCASILNSNLEAGDVVKLGKELNDEGNWMNLHLCLVFLQDLPKLHQFQGNLKPIFLIQMLIQDYRNRCSVSATSKLKKALKIPNSDLWKFETLVYHVMLRLITTSGNDDITEQVLIGEQGCGGVFSAWCENKTRTTKDLVMKNLEELCKRTVFCALPVDCFEQFVTFGCEGNEQDFIQDLSILWLTSKYKDKVLQILPKANVRKGEQRNSIYDALMNGKKCVLKLYRHTKEEILKANTSKTVPLQNEIKIVEFLNALPEPCPNLVQLLGSSIEAPMHMIIERGSKGDLLTFLNKDVNSTEIRNLVHIALDICNAMEFLGNQNVIHRDLRAKNCSVFLQNGKLVAKLGDFHLAVVAHSVPTSPTPLKNRHGSITSKTDVDSSSRFALPWLAVETLQYGVFSSASDVWSYGVLLYEIFTLGCQPYVNMPSGRSLSNDEAVRDFVMNGNRLELHPRIPEPIQNLIPFTMVEADHRPTFSKLKDDLLEIKFEDESYVDSSYFKVPHDNGNTLAGVNSRPITALTGCIPNGCFGECLNGSDIAVPFTDNGGHFIKEFIPATSYELRELSKLKCPSLASVTGEIVHDEKLELIIEVSEYGRLKKFINENGCSMEIAMRYLSQIAEAVSFLHNRRFIHRNLRVDSVFFYMPGDAKLACFARARRLKPNADDQSLTIPIHLPMPDDSLRWSSPEVMNDGEYSKASDIWAFGVLIWEMFTLIEELESDGRDEEIVPYHQLTTKEQILSYLKEDKRLSQPKNCPDWLYEMMLRCWQLSAQERAKSQDIVQCFNE